MAVLTPGTGFAAPVADDLPAVEAPGTDAKVIARWDCVPYQSLAAPLNVGVAAFHMNGIDRVEFAVNGGPVVAVRSMTLNPQTAVVEHWATIDPAGLSKLVEVRAVVYPTCGLPRALPPLILNAMPAKPAPVCFVDAVNGSDANASGSTASPFKTVAAAALAINHVLGCLDGATIYLLPGNYTVAYPGRPTVRPATAAYLTITPAPGVPPSSVRLVGGTSPGFGRTNLCFRGLTLAPTDVSPICNNGGVTWVDGCDYVGPGSDKTHMTASGQVRQFWTGGTMRGVQVAYRLAELVRGATVSDIGEDAFKLCPMVVNCTASGIRFANAGYHPDVWQGYGSTADAPFENAIVYGLKAWDIKGQGIGPTHVRDMAIVGADIDVTAGGPSANNFQASGLLDHVVIDRCRFVGGKSLWQTTIAKAPLAASNVVVRNSPTVPRPFPVGVIE